MLHKILLNKWSLFQMSTGRKNWNKECLWHLLKRKKEKENKQKKSQNIPKKLQKEKKKKIKKENLTGISLTSSSEIVI